MTTAASTTPSTSTYDELIGLVKEANLVHSTENLLWWDQEAMMPSKGVAYRSRQFAQLASIHHRMITDPRVGDLISACEADGQLMADPTGPPAVNVREVRRRYDRQTKVPEELVCELAEVTSLAQHEWAEARKDSDFARFRPWLEKIVDLTKRKAECFGWADGGEPWDALAEDYELGCTAAGVEAVFAPLRERLTMLVSDLMGSATPPDNAFNELELPIEQQQKSAAEVRPVRERADRLRLLTRTPGSVHAPVLQRHALQRRADNHAFPRGQRQRRPRLDDARVGARHLRAGAARRAHRYPKG
jgi:carboxypeptidase Taq